VLPSSALDIGRHPVASGGPGDVYEGTLNGSKVCVKRIRVYTQDGPEEATKVRYPFAFPSLPLLTRIVDSLQRGRSVETIRASEYRPSPRYHFESSSTYFGMDAGWKPDGVHQETPRCRPNRPCECPCCHPLAYAHPRHQLSDVAGGLCFLHSRNIVHGDLKGVRD